MLLVSIIGRGRIVELELEETGSKIEVWCMRLVRRGASKIEKPRRYVQVAKMEYREEY